MQTKLSMIPVKNNREKSTVHIVGSHGCNRVHDWTNVGLDIYSNASYVFELILIGWAHLFACKLRFSLVFLVLS